MQIKGMEDATMLLRFESRSPEEFIADLFDTAGRFSHAESDNSPVSQQGVCACPRVDVAEHSLQQFAQFLRLLRRVVFAVN